jgi:uroporphyrinogen decarboxylase
MDKRENVIRCLNLEKCENVPIALHNFMVCAELMKKPYNDIFSDGKLLAESQIKAYEIFDHDILMIEVGVSTLAEACGCIVEYPVKESPWVKKPVLEKISDVDFLSPPDFSKSIQVTAMFEAIKILKKELGSEVIIMGRGDQGPFDLAGELLGINNFLLEIVNKDNQEYISKLLNYTSKVFLKYALELTKLDIDITSMGESLASPDVVSPDVYRKYAFPYERDIIRIVKKNKIYFSNHICGNVDLIIDDFINTEADIIEIDEKTNFQLAKNKSNGKCCILGQISPKILKLGSFENIENETIKTMDIGKKGYGFILGAGCAISGNTPIVNIKKMMKIGRDLGKYKK